MQQVYSPIQYFPLRYQLGLILLCFLSGETHKQFTRLDGLDNFLFFHSSVALNGPGLPSAVASCLGIAM
jgi:hypothetical protein